ncbi:MAG: hypothetical protein PHT86_06055 [Methanocorpusculum sp.]|nr:hypothetical protein [Methanocorpusculum sp.]
MLTRPERLAIGIMVAVILALGALYIGMTCFLPNGGAISYTPETQDGTFVFLEGIVQDIIITSTGGHLIVNVSGVDVFVPGGGTDLILLDGDYVKVTGKVDTYAGKKEIVTNSISDIRILVRT